MRPATVTTVTGRVTVERVTYSCRGCGAWHVPLDQQLQIAAGGISLGLQELLALLDATRDSFAQAAAVPERLCLVQGCPNRVRAATDDRGAVLAAHAQDVVTTAQTTHTTPPAQTPAAPRVDVSMDGVVAHVHDAGWNAIKVGCISTTRTGSPPATGDASHPGGTAARSRGIDGCRNSWVAAPGRGMPTRGDRADRRRRHW